MTTTERNYSVLEKKLEEFEALLNDVHSDTALDHEEIQARLGFLKIVISSEIELNADVPPERLRNMADRLKVLEDAYENCIGACGLLSDDHHHRDNQSSCSCTSSCLYEEDLIPGDVLGAVNSGGDKEDDGEKNHEKKEDNEVEASIGESLLTTTNMNALSSQEREDQERRGKKSNNFAETMASTKSKSRFPEDGQMISQVFPVRVPSEHKWRNNCGFLTRTVVAAAAVVVVASTRFWSAEEEIYFVPT